jgi:hypothetical protein
MTNQHEYIKGGKSMAKLIKDRTASDIQMVILKCSIRQALQTIGDIKEELANGKR